MDRNTVNILGYGVDSFSFNNAIDYIVNHHGQIVTINPEMIECADKNPEFANIIRNADMVVADGVGIQLGLKILGHDVVRIPGIDLGKALIKYAYENDKSVALIGAARNVIENTVVNLKTEFTKLNIVYYSDGYFTNQDEIFENVIRACPDLILVALGSPKQEFFIYNLKDKLPQAIFVGLGGSFDVWSGNVARAPKIFRKLGAEWIYRIISDPKRIKRVFPTLPLFIFKVLKERLLSK